MYVSMNPNGETGKVIHISQNDTNREVEFIPYDQKGLTPLTDGQLTARINSIKGNTVSFNQLIQNGNFTSTNNWEINGSPSFSVSNNLAILSSTGTNDYFIYQQPKLIANHKYYFSATGYSQNAPSNIRNGGFQFYFGSVANHYDRQLTTSKATYKIIMTAPSEIGYTALRLYSDNGNTSYFGNIMLHDLTLMGIDNLTTTTEVEAWLSSHIGDLPYYDYTQGTLIPFNGSGLKTTGKNLLPLNLADIKAENTSGTWNDNVYTLNNVSFEVNNDGTIVANGTASSSATLKIPFSCVIGETYILNGLPNGASQGTWMLSVSGIGYAPLTFKATNSSYIINATIYTNAVASNVVFKPMVRYEWVIDDTFEAYKGINTLSLPTLTYFPTGMKDCSQSSPVYDEMNLTSGKGHERVGSADLGSLTWTYYSRGQYFYSVRALANDAKLPSSDQQKGNIKCGMYSVVESRLFTDSMTIDNVCALDYNGNLFVRNTSYSDSTTFKNAMSGVMLYFEKATPTETDISLDLTYPVWKGGTEQILPVNDSTPDTAPIKANITYPDRTEDTEFLYKQTSFVFIPRTWAFVCKNITQALSLVGNVLKGTIPGTMTSESGKFPLKVKMTDEDGVCFSEKIDLFVERKP